VNICDVSVKERHGENARADVNVFVNLHADWQVCKVGTVVDVCTKKGCLFALIV